MKQEKRELSIMSWHKQLEKWCRTRLRSCPLMLVCGMVTRRCPAIIKSYVIVKGIWHIFRNLVKISFANVQQELVQCGDTMRLTMIFYLWSLHCILETICGTHEYFEFISGLQATQPSVYLACPASLYPICVSDQRPSKDTACLLLTHYWPVVPSLWNLEKLRESHCSRWKFSMQCE